MPTNGPANWLVLLPIQLLEARSDPAMHSHMNVSNALCPPLSCRLATS